MSKRQGGPAPPPPLPPGPQPQHDPAAVAAAWQQYYAQQGMMTQAAQPVVQPNSAPATTNAYSNYGYGPGAGMPGHGSMNAGMSVNRNMGGAATNHMYGRPQQNPAMDVNMGMNIGHTGHAMPMAGMQGVGMQGVGGGMGIGMQPQGQYAGMYAQPAVQHQQQRPVGYGMQQQPMQPYQPPQQQPMGMAPTAGPVRPPYNGPVQPQIQQPFAAPGPYSSIQPAGPMTPISQSTGRPNGNYQGTRGGRRPGGPGPHSAGPGSGPIGMNGHNGMQGGGVGGGGGNFPPAKRPRMEGPPGNRPMGQPGAMSGPPMTPGPRSAPIGNGMSPNAPMRHGPVSDYGGSQDGRGLGNGPPRGSTRGRGMSGSIGGGMSRGVPGGGRGRGGSFGASSDAGSTRGGPRPIRGSVNGSIPANGPSSYRGRGAKFIPGPGSSSGHAGTPRGPRGSRGSSTRGGYTSSRTGESYGNHRQYQDRTTGPASTKAPPRGPGGPGGKAKSDLSTNRSRGAGGKNRSGDDSEATAAYNEERTRVAREEARKRTMTDFRIIGLEIKQLGWKWGKVRDVEVEDDNDSAASDIDAKLELDDGASAGKENDVEVKKEAEADVKLGAKSTEETASDEVTADLPPGNSKKIGKQSDAASKERGIEKATFAEDTPSGDAKPEVESETMPVPEIKQDADSIQPENAAQQSGVESSSEEVVRKRGEKRKAKMSSPDAEDDARIIAKKRNTHGPNNRTLDSAVTPAPSPEKNRFRIYFASPVERGEGISLKAYLAGKLDEASTEDEAQEFEEAEMDGSGDEYEGQHDEELEEEHPAGYEDQEYHEENVDENEGDPHGKERLDVEGAQEIDQAEAGSDHLGHGPGDSNVASEERVTHEGTAAETEEDPAHKDEQGDADVMQGERSEAEELADVSMITAKGDEPLEKQADGAKESEETEPEPSTAGDVPNDASAVKDPCVAVEATTKDGESAEAVQREAALATAEAQKVALQASAENTSAAYEARSSRQPITPSGPLAHSMTNQPFRRSPSAPPTSLDVPVPTPNRLSILYADGKRRIVLDAAVVEHVQIHRKRGMIKVRIGGFKEAVHEKQVENLAKKTGEMNVAVPAGEEPQGDAPVEGQAEAATAQDGETEEEAEKPKSPVKGILLEALNEGINVFGLGSSSAAAAEDNVPSLPPLDVPTKFETGDDIELIAFLDLGNRLSEPKWVKSGQLEDWISTSPNKSRDGAETAEENWRWRKKLEIVDPDAPTTLASVLEGWAFKSKVGSLKERRRFLNTHLLEGNEFAQILLRASTSNDYTPLSHSQITHTHSILKKSVRPGSVHYEQQSYASLAVMAIINLAKDYAAKANVEATAVNDKIADVIKALPNPVIYANTDKLFEDWLKHTGPNSRKAKPAK